MFAPCNYVLNSERKETCQPGNTPMDVTYVLIVSTRLNSVSAAEPADSLVVLFSFGVACKYERIGDSLENSKGHIITCIFINC